MRWRGILEAAVLVALALRAVPASARDCGVPADAIACTTNDECGCGVSQAGGTCAAQARECVGSGDCGNFCGGFYVSLTTVCRAGRCQRAGASQCAGDCDADAAVGIAELMVGVGVALDLHPLAACANLDVDRDGAVAVSELVRAVRAALDGCATAAARSQRLRGSYDAELTTQGVPSEASAEVYETDDGLAVSINQGPNARIYVSGPLVGDHLTLSGDYQVTDVVYQLSGEATVATVGGEEVIDGSLRSTQDPYPPFPDHFVLRRTASTDASRFSGTYTLHFSESPRGNGQPSSATVELEVAADGFAVSGEGEDRGDGGALFGLLTTGTCRIAPGGHLSCRMGYLLAESELSTPLGLTGGLSADAGGGGQFLSGVDPPFGPEPYVHGSWSTD